MTKKIYQRAFLVGLFLFGVIVAGVAIYKVRLGAQAYRGANQAVAKDLNYGIM